MITCITTEELEKLDTTAKDLLKVIEKADRVSLHADAALNRPSYSSEAVFKVIATRGQGTKAAETSILVAGRMGNGNTSERETVTYEGRKEFRYSGHFTPCKGHWSLFCREEALKDILELLPSSAIVRFAVRMDAGTNGYLVAANCDMAFGREEGLHADHLYLEATITGRNGKTKVRKFLLDVEVGAHNSARFGFY